MERYTPQDILQILTDFYNCQSAFDPEVYPEEVMSFETTIGEWISICNLIKPKELAKSYHDSFNLNTSVPELENLLSNANSTLGDFCNYIAKNTVRQKIEPIKIMGTYCLTASIFKTLIANLEQKGVNTDNIRPGSDIKLLFRRHSGILLEEANKLAPGSFTKFEYEENLVSKAGLYFMLFAFASIFVALKINQFHWGFLIPVTLITLGIVFLFLGSKLKPKKEIIGGYDTVRDLILGMQAKL